MKGDTGLVSLLARSLSSSSPQRCACHHLRLQAQIHELQRRRFSHTRLRAAEEQAKKPQRPPPIGPAPTSSQLANAVQQASRSNIVRNIIEPYAAYATTEQLFKQILRQADYNVPNALKKPAEPAPKNDAGEDIGQGSGIWFASRAQGGIDLPATFGNWAQITILHIYILTVRMRIWPDKKLLRSWEQQLLDHFSYAAEEKMEKWHGMAARGIRNKHLKDLWLQYRGVFLSYDEGLARGDASLGAAVWRSIFKGDETADVADIALVVAYIRREVQRLETVSNNAILTGQYQFGDLSGLQQTLAKTRSVSKDKPISATESAAIPSEAVAA